MPAIEIPSRLDELLKEDRPLHAAVLETLSAFEIWLADFSTGLPLFPEYTDHGPQHIASVLTSSCTLMTAEASKQLRPRDAAALILAVLLHDSAMHLSEDGAKLLIRNRSALRTCKAFDKNNWHNLWTGYIKEARAWDNVMSENVFGTHEEELKVTRTFSSVTFSSVKPRGRPGVHRAAGGTGCARQRGDGEDREGAAGGVFRKIAVESMGDDIQRKRSDKSDCPPIETEIVE
jgi:hypothetical protein